MRPYARAVIGARVAIGTTLLSAVPATVAMAQSPDAIRSKVTTIELKSCKLLKKHEDGNSYICPGHGGNKLYVAEGDLRFFVAAGPKPDKTLAAEQTLRPFNTIFKGRANRAPVEWRFGPAPATQPYATIVRYFTNLDGTKGEVIVVSKVSDKESCHVAMIDALANPNAIELARSIADERAAAFDCSKAEAKAEGTTGKSPM